jgi:hypothetical protein
MKYDYTAPGGPVRQTIPKTWLSGAIAARKRWAVIVWVAVNFTRDVFVGVAVLVPLAGSAGALFVAAFAGFLWMNDFQEYVYSAIKTPPNNALRDFSPKFSHVLGGVVK